MRHIGKVNVTEYIGIKKDGENKITDVVSSVMKSSLAISETLSILNSRSNE